MLDSINVCRVFCLYCRRELQQNSYNSNKQICNDCHSALEYYNSSRIIKTSNNNSRTQNILDTGTVIVEQVQNRNNNVPFRRKDLKLVVLGSTEAKKTELLRTVINDYFEHSYQARIGVDITSKDLYINNREFRLSINDVCGEDRFSTIRRIFFTGAHIVLFVCNMASSKSLDDILNIWNEEFELYLASRTNRYRCIKFLLGNNYNTTELLSVTKEELQTIAMRTGCIGYGICGTDGSLIDASFNTTTGTLEDIFTYLASEFSFTL